MRLHGLQPRSNDAGKDWQQYDAALERLATRVAPADGNAVVSAASDTGWLAIGPVERDAKQVTIQRDEQRIAAIVPRDDGRLRVAVFRPLDAKSASCRIGLGQIPGQTPRCAGARITGSTPWIVPPARAISLRRTVAMRIYRSRKRA